MNDINCGYTVCILQNSSIKRKISKGNRTSDSNIGSFRLDGDKKGTIQLSNAGGNLMLYDEDNSIIDHISWSKRQIDRLPEGIAFLFDVDN